MTADPFWTDLAKQLGVNAAILTVGGFVLKRWIENSMAKRTAEKSLIELKDAIIAMKDEVIKEQLKEIRKRDGEWQEKLDRKDKDFLEFRRKVFSELETARQITRSMNEELKAINEGRFPEQRGDTQMLIDTGSGPLERFADDGGE